MSSTTSPDRGRKWPLSFAQRQFWMLSQLYPNSPAHQVLSLSSLEGELDVQALEKAFLAYLHRHDVFRTVIEVQDGKPVQYLIDNSELNFTQKDYRHLDQAEALRQMHREMEELRHKPFDLIKPPFQRILLYHVRENLWYLANQEPHISFDLRSRMFMNEEITNLYSAYKNDEPSTLSEPEYQSSQYTQWQLEWVASEEATAKIEQWRALLDGFVKPPAIPLDFPRSGHSVMDGATLPISFPPSLHKAIRKFSFNHVLPEKWGKASVTCTLTAAMALLQARQSGQAEQTVGFAFGNRMNPGQVNFHGCAVNALPVPIYVDQNEDFISLARQVQEKLKQVRDLQQVPFDYLVDKLNVNRSNTHTPLFQTSLIVEPQLKLQLEGIKSDVVPLPYRGTKNDLNMMFTDIDETMEGFFEYNPSLFEESRAQKVLEQFVAILNVACAHPVEPLSQLDLLPEQEKALLVEEWGKGYPNSEPFASLSDWIKHYAAHSPEALAITFGQKQVSYAELLKQVQTAAVALVNHGVAKGDLVGLCCERSIEMIVGVLAIQMAGAAYLPLDPSYPEERINWMVSDSGIARLLTQETLKELFVHMDVSLLSVNELFHADSGNQDVERLPQLTPEDRAYVIYTSGSTGKPKGVEILHGGMSGLATGQKASLKHDSRSRVMQFASLSFDASVWEMLMAFTSGGTLCLASRPETLPGSEMIAFLRDNRISMATLPPSVLAALPKTDLPELKTLIVAGEACPARLVHEWSQGRDFYNAYGPTETTVCASVAKCVDDGKKPSIGKPLPNVKIVLLNEKRQLVPAGAIGELCVGGPLLARGYLHRPDLTEDRFIPNPIEGETGHLYRTGDLARWRMDGTLELIGRVDNQVKIRGFRVELGEIEVVLGSHPDLSQVAVIPAGENGLPDHLVGYCVAKQGVEIDLDAVKSFATSQLPNHMVPSVFVVLEELPLTSNDKIDRKQLEQRAGDEKPVAVTSRDVNLNETERKIADIWKQVLLQDRIGLNDNFFDIGGHSLSIMSVRTKLEAEFSRPIDAVVMFQYPTIASMAHYLSGDNHSGPGGTTDRSQVRQQHASSVQQRRQARLQHRKSTKKEG